MLGAHACVQHGVIARVAVQEVVGDATPRGAPDEATARKAATRLNRHGDAARAQGTELVIDLTCDNGDGSDGALLGGLSSTVAAQAATGGPALAGDSTGAAQSQLRPSKALNRSVEPLQEVFPAAGDPKVLFKAECEALVSASRGSGGPHCSAAPADPVRSALGHFIDLADLEAKVTPDEVRERGARGASPAGEHPTSRRKVEPRREIPAGLQEYISAAFDTSQQEVRGRLHLSAPCCDIRSEARDSFFPSLQA